MSNKKSFSGSGLGIGTVLFLIFLVLKLGGIGIVADWSWWYVTAPLWIPAAIVMALFALIGIISSIK